MLLARHLPRRNILDIQGDTLEEALSELLVASTARISENLNGKRLLRALLEREKTMTTYLGNSVAMPHVRIKMKRPFIVAVGRCRKGMIFDGLTEGKEVRLIVLLIASNRAQNYLSVLASLARQFQDKRHVDFVLEAEKLEDFQARVLQGFGGLEARPKRAQEKFNRSLLTEALVLARAARCTAMLFFADTFAGGFDISGYFPKMRTVAVTRTAPTGRGGHGTGVDAVIEVQSFSDQRLSQLRSAVLIGLTRGLFKHNDRLCCIGGIPLSNQLDTLLIVDVAREFQKLLIRDTDLLPASVKVEVMERVLAIATELSLQGREGRPVGCLFVIGDASSVNNLVKPLVMNPFQGYSELDRNVLNPFMDETIKEFSSIDGAFIIRGDGVVESAGSLLSPAAEFYGDLPSGLGARHSAASAISRASDCIAIVVSASSGQVSIFRKGEMLPLISKSSSGNI